MSDFTPGPWVEIDTQDDLPCIHIIQDSDEYLDDDSSTWPNGGFDIALCYGSEKVGNARLIAAAPDLLEALRGMFAMWRSVCRAQGWEPEHLAEAVRAQAAIAKATGDQP